MIFKINYLFILWYIAISLTFFYFINSLRIKLPPSDFDPQTLVSGRPRPKSAGPKMSFGPTQGVRKKQEGGPQTTVDLMLNSGNSFYKL